MTYNEFKSVIVFGEKEPAEWDFYRVSFNTPKTDQEFFDYFYAKVPGLDHYPFFQKMQQSGLLQNLSQWSCHKINVFVINFFQLKKNILQFFLD